MVMTNVVKLQRRPRPLRKTYNPTAPYEVEREDWDNGTIAFHVVDVRPESYRTVCTTNDDGGHDAYAKHDAEQIARGLNLMVQYGKETLPDVKKREFDEPDDIDDFDFDDEES
jgi:hypothetical protein